MAAMAESKSENGGMSLEDQMMQKMLQESLKELG